MASSSPLKTDSPVARRIVRSFIDFLNSVEAAPGTDLEGLEVAKECLAEVFKLDSSCIDDSTRPNLVDIFSSLESRGKNEQGIKSDRILKETTDIASGSSSIQNAVDANLSDLSKCLGNDWSRESFATGVSTDELFGQFFAALEKIHFFRTLPDGSDDTAQLDKATRLFHDAVTEMEGSGNQALNKNSLAESLKSQGNRAMKSKLYSDAIELYTCAIALYEDNAVYYCNRAAAYTHVHKYNEAISDCLKSIEIDPNYGKAYSRLGLVYYAQGNYADAIEKGFKKALQLDPNNESVKENIRVSELKLKEEQQRREQDQNTGSAGGSNQNSHNQSTGGTSNRGGGGSFPFTSMPFDSNSLPADFASMLMNMAANAYQGQHPQNPQGEETGQNPPGEPEIRLGGGNVSVNFGDQMPEELTGALRSVMQMFSGAAPGGNQHDSGNGRPPAN